MKVDVYDTSTTSASGGVCTLIVLAEYGKSGVMGHIKDSATDLPKEKSEGREEYTENVHPNGYLRPFSVRYLLGRLDWRHLVRSFQAVRLAICSRNYFLFFERMVRMTITRLPILLTLAAGLFFSVVNTTTALAQATAEHPHAAEHGSHAGGHGQDAVKAEKEISKALAALSEADRKQAEAQRFCPIMLHTRLGATDTPHKVTVGGTSVFVCCEGCIEHAEKGGKATLAVATKLTKASAAMAKMSAQDRAAAESQKYCAIANKNFLGSMGAPIRLELDGKPVFLCCKGCVKKANADASATLAKAEALVKAGKGDDHKGSGHKH